MFKLKVLLLSISFLLVSTVPSQANFPILSVKKLTSKSTIKKVVSKPIKPTKTWIDEGDSCNPTLTNTVKGYPKGLQTMDWLKCDDKTKKYIRIAYDPYASPKSLKVLLKMKLNQLQHLRH